MIEKGQYNIEEFTTEIKDYTSSIIESIKDMNVTAMNKVVVKCNSCSDGDIMELGNAYKCSNIENEGCNFPIIWKKIGGKSITDEIVKDLVSTGRTQILKGFKNKEGVSFDAALIIDKENNKIKYDFTKHTIGECPKCKTGKVEKGSKFYKCNNKDGRHRPQEPGLSRRHRARLRQGGPQRGLQVQQPERQGPVRVRRELQRLSRAR